MDDTHYELSCPEKCKILEIHFFGRQASNFQGLRELIAEMAFSATTTR